MKKVLHLVIIVCLFNATSNAQITKGSLFLGGDIGGSVQKTKSEGITTNKQSGVYISPVIGKAIKENLVLGLNLGFNLSDNDTPPIDGKSDTKSYTAGMFLRKYKNIATSGFYIFVQGGLSVNYYNSTQENNYVPYDEVKRTTMGISAYPGLSYAVNRKLHLETGFNNLIMLNYHTEKRVSGNPSTTYKTNGFNVASSLNNSSYLYLGFRLLIGK